MASKVLLGSETGYLFPGIGPAVAYHSDSNKATVPKQSVDGKATPVKPEGGFFVSITVLTKSPVFQTTLPFFLPSTRLRIRFAKGGITSSDVATAGLGIQQALVLEQICLSVPVVLLGSESRFANLPYVVVPGNTGDCNDLGLCWQLLHEQGIYFTHNPKNEAYRYCTRQLHMNQTTMLIITWLNLARNKRSALAK